MKDLEKNSDIHFSMCEVLLDLYTFLKMILCFFYVFVYLFIFAESCPLSFSYIDPFSLNKSGILGF